MSPADGSCPQPSTVYVHGDVESLCACSECGKAFVPRDKSQRTCGSATCKKRRSYRLHKERLAAVTQPPTCIMCGKRLELFSRRKWLCSDACRLRREYQRKRSSASAIERNRARCRAWAIRVGKTREGSRRPWLVGPPAFGELLPGAVVPMRIDPLPPWLRTMAGATTLHGLVSSIFGDCGFPHDQAPPFALMPSRRGWHVYVADMDMAEVVRSWSIRRRCGHVMVEVTFGEPARVAAPTVRGRGRRVLRVTGITPTFVRRSVWADEGKTRRSSRDYDRPTAENLASALLRVGERLGLDKLELHRSLRLEVVEEVTQSVALTARKLGQMRGWTGDVLVRTNAVGEWLLRAAETIGLGGRVGFGFGRIGVTVEEGRR